MQKPIVAIVGRPNVGKSTLFNKIIGKKIAVVGETPGLTRDRIYGEAVWEKKQFFVVDTGGFLPEATEDIAREVKKQALAAIEEADIILMLMDASSGLMPIDTALNNTLRKHDKKVFYAVNKIDSQKKESALYEFYSLGEDLHPVSALCGYGFDELMDKISEVLPEIQEAPAQYPQIAIVGRPNVGKSTLVNSLLGAERMIVSPVAGTTRDAVDSICTYYGRKYLVIDTAGIRRKGKMAQTLERFSFLRTLKNIERCDIALIVMDASEGVVETDQKIASLVHDTGKGAIILLNKWDLVEKDNSTLKTVEKKLREKLWFMPYVPVITISALSRQRVTKIFSLIDEVIAESSKRIPTHDLNVFLKKSLAVQPPPIYKSKPVKLNYITQAGIKPPSFVIFTNRLEGIKQPYIKFLENQLRKGFAFTGVPVKFYIRQSRKTHKQT
ncbi:MAG: ribosome biogenesis GTPase Der [Nitrospirae bacterium]|nr:ribosome biogenesis GTPase Der [Nitrospirota bacterium]